MTGLSATDSALLAPLFTSAAMRALFGDAARVQAMLDFEAALARAEARVGIIPASAVAPIEAACRAELYDFDALGRAAALAGMPTIPLVKALTAKVEGEAARYVHWGATSQDILDTGLVLQMRAAFDLLDRQLDALGDATATLAEAHRGTVMAGRTWLQHALPTTLGAKAASWLDALTRHRQRMGEARGRVLLLSFAGASGTLASLGPDALPVAEALAEDLALPLPAAPWHTARDGIAEAGALLGMLSGTSAKIALDIALLMQTEIGEAFEGAAPGKGSSSTMPQKRNPAGSAAVFAAARQAQALVPLLMQAMLAEHERPFGAWQTEWGPLAQAFALASGAVEGTTGILAGLEVDARRMRANLDATGGQILSEALMMALAPSLGKSEAHRLVADLCRTATKERRHLREAAAGDPHVSGALSPDEIDRVFDPANYIGLAEIFADRAVAGWRGA